MWKSEEIAKAITPLKFTKGSALSVFKRRGACVYQRLMRWSREVGSKMRTGSGTLVGSSPLSAFFIIMPMSSPITFESSLVGLSVKPPWTVVRSKPYAFHHQSTSIVVGSREAAGLQSNLF